MMRARGSKEDLHARRSAPPRDARRRGPFLRRVRRVARARPDAGDVSLEIDSSLEAGEEGYVLAVGDHEVEELGLLEMAHYMKKQETTNGWLYFTEGVGNFGTNYVLRGMANLLGPGWNRPHEAVYPIAKEDVDGHKLNGAKHNYNIHFAKGQLPPVEAFWSLTMYDTSYDGVAGYLVKNPIDRFLINSTTEGLVFGPDGSLTLYIQHDEPNTQEGRANWLPAPEGEFYLILRLYAAKPEVLTGKWTPPPVVRTA